MPVKKKDLSIVIVNWNVSALLQACVQSVWRCTKGISFEIIVVDNASSDDSVAMLEKNFPQIRVIQNVKNRGFNAANNQGVAVSNGQFIMLLNPDTYVVDNALGTLVNYLYSHPRVGVCGPKLMWPTGVIQAPCARAFPSVFGVVLEFSGLLRFVPASNQYTFFSRGYPDKQHERLVDCVSGAALMARKQVFDEIGGLDERFFMYADDVDACRQAVMRGWRTAYVPSARVFHYGGQSSKQNAATLLYPFESMYAYLKKNHGPVQAGVYRAAIFFISCAKLAVSLIFLRKTVSMAYLQLILSTLFGKK